MRSLPLSEAREWHQRLGRGDAEAIVFYAGLFTANDPCWLCDEPVGASPYNVTFQDDGAPRLAVIAPECVNCHNSPDRDQLQLAMMRAMWPRAKMRRHRDSAPGYMRGPPPKQQRARHPSSAP